MHCVAVSRQRRHLQSSCIARYKLHWDRYSQSIHRIFKRFSCLGFWRKHISNWCRHIGKKTIVDIANAKTRARRYYRHPSLANIGAGYIYRVVFYFVWTHFYFRAGIFLTEMSDCARWIIFVNTISFRLLSIDNSFVERISLLFFPKLHSIV